MTSSDGDEIVCDEDFAYCYSPSRGRPSKLVFSTGPLNNGPDVVTAMLTSSARRLATPGPGDLVLVDWREAGLPKPSTVRTGKLRTWNDVQNRLVVRPSWRLFATWKSWVQDPSPPLAEGAGRYSVPFGHLAVDRLR